MSRPRYIAWILPDPGSHVPEVDDLIDRAKDLLGPEVRTISAGRLRLVYRCPSVIAAASKENVVVLGQVFSGLGDAGMTSLDPSCSQEIIASAGASLVRNHWGRYVAFVIRGEGNDVSVIRDPSVGVPCYYHQHGHMTVISSDMDLASQCGGLPLQIDWDGVALHLQASQLRRPGTCINGYTELLGGQRLSVSSENPVIDQVWSPWTFAARENQIFDEEHAASRLRETIVGCVRSLSCSFEHSVLTVSGGLDSSIVAASLATIGARFTCLTMATEEPIGDERLYARIIAKTCGAPLVERFEDLDAVDLIRCDSAYLPRPVSRAFAQSIDRACQDLADEVGAAAFLGGAGGDNVFCFLLSAAPVADHLRCGELIAALLAAHDVAHLGEASVLHVLGKAARRAWRRPDFRWRRDFMFLSAQIRNGPLGGLDHPWLTAPRGAAPGKAGHIAAIMNIHNHLEGFAREHERPVIAPLLAQPIVELCLRIPASSWCRNGRDRWIARRAFADRLPHEILERRDKGGPDGFVARLFDRHRGQIGDWLCHGELAGQGLLDVQALAMFINGDGPVIGQEYLCVMKLLDAEMWARSLASRTQGPV